MDCVCFHRHCAQEQYSAGGSPQTIQAPIARGEQVQLAHVSLVVVYLSRG